MSNMVANRWSERGGGFRYLAMHLTALIGAVLTSQNKEGR
jgi:hypothetical protein